MSPCPRTSALSSKTPGRPVSVCPGLSLPTCLLRLHLGPSADARAPSPLSSPPALCRSPGSPAPGSRSGSCVESFHKCWKQGVSWVWAPLIPFPAPSLAVTSGKELAAQLRVLMLSPTLGAAEGTSGHLPPFPGLPRSHTLLVASPSQQVWSCCERGAACQSPGHPTPPSAAVSFLFHFPSALRGLGQARE